MLFAANYEFFQAPPPQDSVTDWQTGVPQHVVCTDHRQWHPDHCWFCAEDPHRKQGECNLEILFNQLPVDAHEPCEVQLSLHLFGRQHLILIQYFMARCVWLLAVNIPLMRGHMFSPCFSVLSMGSCCTLFWCCFLQNSHNYEVCGVLLGTGNLLVWFGVLRYLGFFEKYNVSLSFL